MTELKNIIIAAKCVPQEELLASIEKSGLEAVELFISGKHLKELRNIIRLCDKFPFTYAVHAHSDGLDTQRLAGLVEGIGASALVFHNIYWEDEWSGIVKLFKNIKTKLCIENTYSVHESLKLMRRFGLSRCLDLEHLQLECCGVYEEEFINAIKLASHIHLTGYVYGSKLWHSHIHSSPKHGMYMLNLLKNAGYSGMVVSEAKPSLQTYAEFRQLYNFFQTWKRGFF